MWLLALLGVIVATSINAAETPEAALEAHMRAINTLEAEQILATQHFPFNHLWHDGRSDYVATAAEFENVPSASGRTIRVTVALPPETTAPRLQVSVRVGTL